MKINNKISILIADDEEEITKTLASTITLKSEEYGLELSPIIIANDGTAAINKLRNQRFDFVILDNDMPKKTGLEVLAFISEKDELRGDKTNVIFVSGKLQAETIEQLKQYRIIDTITKPFDIDRIMQKIVKLSTSKKKVPKVGLV